MLKIYFFLIGMILSSTFCLVVERIIKHDHILFSRSKCSSCNCTLKWFSLIPVVSFIFQRGRCTKCKNAIPLYLLYYEMIGGFIFYNLSSSTLPIIVFLSILEVISIFDLLISSFPLYLSIILIIISFLINPNISHVILILIIYVAIQILMYFWPFIGNGDIDVFLSIFVIVGLEKLSFIVLLSCLLSLVITLITRKAKLPFVAILFPIAVFIISL